MSTPYYTEAHQRSLSRLIPDLIRSRELLWDLVVKGLKIRYRIAAMGFFWAVLQPLLMMTILTIVFGYMLGDKLGLRSAVPGHRYHVIVLSGVVLWQFFASSVLTATSSLVASRDLIKKVYFPREVVPISTVLDWAFNLMIGTILLIIIHLISGGNIGAGVFWILLVFAIVLALVLGLALLLSASNVFFRDIQYIVEVAVAFGFYATPVFYELPPAGDPHTAVWIAPVLLVNPLTGLITVFREILFDGSIAHPVYLVWPAVAAILVLAGGAYVFRRNAGAFADNL